jgi:hypothetical protein
VSILFLQVPLASFPLSFRLPGEESTTTDELHCFNNIVTLICARKIRCLPYLSSHAASAYSSSSKPSSSAVVTVLCEEYGDWGVAVLAIQALVAVNERISHEEEEKARKKRRTRTAVEAMRTSSFTATDAVLSVDRHPSGRGADTALVRRGEGEAAKGDGEREKESRQVCFFDGWRRRRRTHSDTEVRTKSAKSTDGFPPHAGQPTPSASDSPREPVHASSSVCARDALEG